VIFRSSAWFVFLLTTCVALALALPREARAQSNDEDVDLVITSVLETEYLNTKFQDALEKLELAKQACKGKGCSPKVRAKVYIAVGTVLAGGMKKTKEAKVAFVQALKEDPTATPFADYITTEIQQAFNDARGAPSASGGSSEVKPTESSKPKKQYTGGRPPKGWRSGEAYFYFREASEAEAAREWSECNTNAQASLAVENRPSTRFLAATCAEKSGLWIEALGDYQIVADTAGNPQIGLFDTANQARARAQALREKIPKIIIRKPAKATDLVVKMNDAEVPLDKLGGEIWINPGERLIVATGKVDGADYEFDERVNVAEFESATVDIKLLPKGVKKDADLARCFAQAKSREDIAKCVNGGGSSSGSSSGVNLRASFEFSAYHDSDSVDTVTPAFALSAENKLSGWGVGGSFLIDVVTAASADIVATASPRWTEVRYVPALNGHKKFDPADISLKGSMSVEPDYLATSVGAGISLELFDKNVTPSLGYEFSYDISGRAGTGYDVFSRKLTRHGLDGGVGLVLDKSTFLVLSFTAVFEDGDSSKPYRYVPMFSPTVAPLVQTGQSIESVNLARNGERVLEQLPTERQRWAVAGRIAHRFTSSTIRLEERLYVDNWGLKASTTDGRFLVDFTKDIRAWPHLRFHVQSPVSFWQLAYVSDINDQGVGQIPALRTGDRELGPLYSITGGLGGRLAFGSHTKWGLTITGDVVYTRFLDHLFILQRFGYFGATALEAEFE
jgi:hypothetical protein